MKARMRVLVASLAIAASPMAFADDDAASLGTQSSMNHGQASVANGIASEFRNIAGSRQNALALVNGLRNGTDITLTSKTPPATGTGGSTGTTTGSTGGSTGTTTTTTTTIDPPTGKMGWGEVRIALSLAETELKQAGITKPTPAQLQAALNGGDVTVTHKDGTTTTTTLKGVLAERASGMGWGQIAKAEGTTVGHALHAAQAASHTHVAHVDDDASKKAGPGGSKSTKTATASTGTSKSATVSAANSKGATPGTHGSKGIATASGADAGSGSHVTTAQGGSGGGNTHAYGRGVVTGAGGGVTTVASTAGVGHGASSPLVTGAGGSAGSGVTTAQGSSGDGHHGEHGKGGKAGG